MLIAGPTASGKSAVAMDIADACGGVVINVDSMQVYRDLAILTARPDAADEARIPHRLYGYVDAADPYSVARWRQDAAEVLRRLDGRLPVFVGGSGLYFEALLNGLSDVPPIPEAIRTHWRARGREETPMALHAELAARDPLMAGRLRTSDTQRIIRALEVVEATGASLASFQSDAGHGLLQSDRCLKLVLDVPPENLRAQINGRFEKMIAAGALEEVRALAARGLDPALPVMKAHGVPWLMAHLRGEMRLDEAIVRAQGDTRRYAKRQRTWLRQRMAEWSWVAPKDAVLFATGLLQPA